MSRARFNATVFLLEGLNSIGTAFYFNYLFFFLKSEHGFSSFQNLLVCALNGLVYIPFAYLGGRCGQRRGYLAALNLGFALMCGALSWSALAKSIHLLLLLMIAWTIGMCFTWPNLEALVSDHLQSEKLPAALGAYNVVWAGSSALAYFSGGAIAESLGWRSIFWVPAALHVLQLVIAQTLPVAWEAISSRPPEAAREPIERPPGSDAFLKMAWLANPFAYIAINAVIPLIPDLANRFHLSPKFAGFFCSIWFFARMFTFAALTVWQGWHYRFGCLAAAYLGMLVSFAAMLLAPNLWVLLAAQVLFGWCIGVIYYSSLYYSMHVGDTKAIHGGVHEAAIGVGIFGGPAIGAASAHFFPGREGSSVLGVALALSIGFFLLWMVRRKSSRNS